MSVCMYVCPPIGCRTITSAILFRFSLNFAYCSEMWLFQTLLFLRQTGSILPILEMCKFRFWQFCDCGGHIFPRIVTKTPITHAILCLIWQKFECGCEMWSAGQLLFLWQTGSRYPILEVCEFQFWQCHDSSCHTFLRILAVLRLHLIDPSSIEHKCLLLPASRDSYHVCWMCPLWDSGVSTVYTRVGYC